MNEEQLKELLKKTPQELRTMLDNEEIDLMQFREVGAKRLEGAPTEQSLGDPADATPVGEEVPKTPELVEQQPEVDRFEKFNSPMGSRSFAHLGETLPEPEDDLYKQAMTVQSKPKEDGIITKIGTTLQDIVDYPADKANEIVSGLKDTFDERLGEGNDLSNAVGFLEDNVFKSADQQFKDYATNPVGSVIAGGGKGIEAGMMIPLTVAGAIANQNTDPWSDPPEYFKGNLAAEAAFEVMQILTPTLIGGALVGPSGGALPLAGGVGGLVGESALETATQDSADEVLLSRTIAYQIGKAADALNPGSGEEVINTLLNGEPGSQAYLAVLGMFQNMGINLSPDAIRYLVKKNAKPVKEVVEAAKASGKSADEVNKAVNNTTQPPYTPDTEPSTASASSVDTGVPVSKSEKAPIQEDAMAAEALRQQTTNAKTTVINKKGVEKKVDPNVMPLGNSALDAPTRRYFTNLETWAKTDFARKGIEKASEYYRKLKLAAPERLRIIARSADWYLKNRELFIRGIDGEDAAYAQFLQKFYDDMTKTEEGARYKKGKTSTADKIKQVRETTKAGTVVGGFIGEELGVRIQKAALQVSNLENSGMNTDHAMRNFMRLVALGENFFVPIRKSARSSSQGLALRKKEAMEKAFDMLQNFEDNMVAKFNKMGADEKAVALETLVNNSNMEELFRKAKAGDDASKQLLNQIVNQLAYSDPSTLLTALKFNAEAIKSAQRGMTQRAIKQAFYAMMLTRGMTQAAAFATTMTRMIAEPLFGGLWSGAVDVARGDVKLGVTKAMVGLAQFGGGWNHVGSAMSAFRRSFKENSAINSGERFKLGAEPQTLQLQSSKSTLAYKARLLEIAKNGEGPAAAWSAHAQHMLQKVAFNPYVNYGPRLLQAQDEGFKVLRAAQVAQGDAMLRALDDKSLKNLSKYSIESFKDVFQSGAENGVIRIDTDLGQFALESSRRFTFQRALPDLEDANFFDKMFIALDSASETSAVFKYFNPFVRMGWDVTSQTFEGLPGVNAVYTRNFGSKARKIIKEGTADGATAVQRARMLELESGFAAANLAGMGAVWFAWQGLMTGSQGGDNRPVDSFIIPLGDGNEMAIDYSRFEPYATWMRVIADSVNEYRRGNMSRGEYDKATQAILGSMAQSTLDKNIFAGVVDMTELFNYQNWNGGSLHTILASLVGFSPAIVRAMGGMWEPYGKITYAKGDFGGNVASALDRRITGGVSLPDKINPFFNVPEAKVAVGYDAGITEARLGMLLQEFLPFKVQNVMNKNNKIYNFFDKVGFKWNHNKYMHQVQGVKLDKNQQAILARDMFEVAELPTNMQAWIDQTGNGLWEKFQEQLKIDGSAEEGTTAHVYLEAIREGIRKIIREAKVDAMRNGELRSDPVLLQQLNDNIEARDLVSTGPGARQWKGLYQTAAEVAANDQIPTEIQTILDIA